MLFNQSRNTMTQAQLDEVVQQHGLWLTSGGSKGKRVDLSRQILIGLNLPRANLREANLREANLRGANLRGADLRKADFREANLQVTNLQVADLRGADLRGADLRGADLRGADLRGAKLWEAIVDGNIQLARNWQHTVGLNLPVDSPTADLEQQIRQQSQQINQLYKELAQAAAGSSETGRLQKELAQAQQEKADMEAELQQVKDDAKANLSKEIDKAQQALSEIFKEGMQKQIDEHKKSAHCIGFFALFLILVDFVLVIGFVLSHWSQRNASAVNDASEISSASAASGVSAVSSGGAALDWSFAAHSFPVLVIFVLATTLLRHQKKLLDEVRHFSAAKHQVELYSGLLKASQHAAAHLNDPSKSAEYVQETFGKIRDKLLQYQFAAPADGKDGDAGGAADKLVDKIIEKAVSGGKNGS